MIEVHFSPQLLGPVRWKSNDAVYNFKQVFFGTSAELDCELTSPDVNVTFGIHQHDGSYADIAIDGKKYESRGRQVLKINHLTIDDAMEYACQADGVENKLVLFMVKESKYLLKIFHLFSPFSYYWPAALLD